ncbi:MAG: carbohydrate kinase family protein [Candidatus Hodarchaeota archaeon]
MQNKILVIGRLLYRLKFTVSDDFDSLINKGKETFNTNASDVHRSFDGMAANIAYGLALLDSSPVIVSQVGFDFNWAYRPHLEKLGIELKLFIDPEKETAQQYKIEDKQRKVFSFEQENSYRFLAERDILEVLDPKDLQDLSAVFIGTGKIEADTKFITIINKYGKNLPLIYSPDGNITELTKWRLSQIVDKITLLVCTEDELKTIENRMKQSINEILNSSNRLKYIISLIDRSKIVVHSAQFKMKVSEGPAEEILSIDSWEDAFRAGLLYGVSLKKPILEAAQLGSALASYAVERREKQQYSPSLEQVRLRAFEVKTVQKIK